MSDSFLVSKAHKRLLDVLVFSFPVAAVQSLLASSAIIFAVNAVLHCYHQPRHRAQVSVQCSRVDTEADHDESDDARRDTNLAR